MLFPSSVIKKQILIGLTLLFSSTFVVSQIPNSLTNAEKVYGLSKFWQEVNYNFVYLNTIDKDKWNTDYKKLITEVQRTSNDYEYYRLLQKYCATLKDGHTNVYMPDTVWNMLMNTYFGEYRLFISNIDGKAIVTRTNLSKKDELPVGTEIIKINGLTTSKYLETYVKPYISSSTKHVLQDWSISNLFRSPIGTSYEVVFKLPSSEIKVIKLVHSITHEQEVFPPFPKQNELMSFKMYDAGVAYVSLNSFEDQIIDSLFISKLPELYKANALIIDLRNNGGGNTQIGRKIFKYLTYDTVLSSVKSSSRLHIPSFKAWGKWVTETDTFENSWNKKCFLSYRDDYYHYFENVTDTIKEKIKRLVIPTVILIGHNTASAAEDFLMYANNQSHMTKIGEPTFGSTGQPMLFDLPGGGSARVCTKKDTYPSGQEFVGYGIQPDILIHKTLNDYLNNIDPELIKAIGFLNEHK